MPRAKNREQREHRITMEIIVDAYSPEEQAMGWYYYLEEKLRFPFKAKCINERPISPLPKGDRVEVVKMTPEDECDHEMFVSIRWDRRTIAVPLSQLRAVAVDKGTQEAIEDWQYWLNQGYEL